MILHSLYQARIVSHANTGKASWGKRWGQNQISLLFLLSCTCLLSLKAILVLPDTE
jgi:hypothetical protein